MSRLSTYDNDAPVKYNPSFRVGVMTGLCFCIMGRSMRFIKFTARPLEYVKVPLGFGIFFWYYDYARRIMLERSLEREELRIKTFYTGKFIAVIYV